MVPVSDYSELGLDRALSDWHWLSMMFNRVNRSMGQRDLYPFTLNEPVVDKLAFVHRLVVAAGSPALRKRSRRASSFLTRRSLRPIHAEGQSVIRG